jgi:hypothetical protein
MDFLQENGVEIKTLHQLLAEHMVDELQTPDVLYILNDFQQNPIYDTQEVFKGIKMYITRQLLILKNIKGFLWKEKGKQLLFVKSNAAGAGPWHLAEPEDIKDFQPKLSEQKTNILTNLNPFMGFMNNFKTEDFVVFKIKDVNNSRDAGARCDQNSNKGKAIDILNTIVGANNYKNPPSKDLSQKELCVIQEFYLRLFDKERKNKKRWFLSPPEAVLVAIEKYSTVEKKGKKTSKA